MPDHVSEQSFLPKEKSSIPNYSTDSKKNQPVFMKKNEKSLTILSLAKF